jgi:hypothetical protein
MIQANNDIHGEVGATAVETIRFIIHHFPRHAKLEIVNGSQAALNLSLFDIILATPRGLGELNFYSIFEVPENTAQAQLDQQQQLLHNHHQQIE